MPEYDNRAICGQGRVRTIEAVRSRREPSLTAAIIASWRGGEGLDVWAQIGDWLLVQHEDGRTGWTHRGFTTPV